MPAAESTLIRRCRLIELGEDWYLDEEQVTKGNRRKFTASALTPQAAPVRGKRRWIWKTSKVEYPLEFWSEVMAYHIGECLEVEVPYAFPARFKGEYGALMWNFVNLKENEVLDHGGDILMGVKPDYERDRGSDHSVQLVLSALRRWKLDDVVYTHLFHHLLLDALIGNSDRHQDNWGLVVVPSADEELRFVRRPAPAFDNGSSLGRELLDPKIELMLAEPWRIERYIDRGRAHIRWEEDGNLLQVTHEELLRRHLRRFDMSRLIAADILGFLMPVVERAVRRICALSRSCPGVDISANREELIVLLLKRRRERLLRLMTKEE
ncbi:MAG: hypothetical protein ACR2HJ_04805 [Fimbriimonadales bacterium]